MTNGEKLKEMFPNAYVVIDNSGGYVMFDIHDEQGICQVSSTIRLDWWNSECMEGKTNFEVINNAPTIPLPDFKEGYKQAIIDGKTNFSRPQGEWVEKQETPASVSYYCSNCKMSDLPFLPYCPWCGAKMKEGADMRKGGAE